MNERSAVVLDTNSDTLVIHMERAGFADFVKGLLGQPQTIENLYAGAFDIGKDAIENLFHLVDQRVSQQNQAHLIQFSIKIYYSDDSSVLLNSLTDFKSYREIRPQQSTSANLTWTYLIQFPDRQQPERQVIELLIRTGDEFKRNDYVLIGKSARRFSQGFKLTIEHTARTWAADMENLFSHQIRSWIITEPWLKRTIYENSGWVGIISGGLFGALTAIGFTLTNNSIEDGLRNSIEQALTLSIDGKLDYLMHAIFDARLRVPENYLVIGGGVSFITTVLVAIGIGVLADNPPKSYLVISEYAATKRLESLKKRRKGWQYFLATGITATVAGFLSKFLFLLIVGK